MVRTDIRREDQLVPIRVSESDLGLVLLPRSALAWRRRSDDDDGATTIHAGKLR